MCQLVSLLVPSIRCLYFVFLLVCYSTWGSLFFFSPLDCTPHWAFHFSGIPPPISSHRLPLPPGHLQVLLGIKKTSVWILGFLLHSLPRQQDNTSEYRIRRSLPSHSSLLRRLHQRRCSSHSSRRLGSLKYRRQPDCCVTAIFRGRNLRLESGLPLSYHRSHSRSRTRFHIHPFIRHTINTTHPTWRIQGDSFA